LTHRAFSLALSPGESSRPSLAAAALPATIWIPVVYALLAGAWIAFSDLLVESTAQDSHQLAVWSLVKGLGFVAVTAILLHLGVRGALKRQARAYEQSDEARREGEVRLARSELRYRILAEGINDVLWTFDLATRRFTYVSPSISKLRGLTVEEALDEPLERSLTPESLERVQSYMSRVGTPDDQRPITAIYDQPCKDGTVKHVEITTTLVRDQHRRPVEVIGVSRDATARVEAERALSDRERHLRTILEAALDGFWLLDDRGHVLQVNDEACAMTGYSREELLGMRIADLEAAETAEEIRGHVERTRARGIERFESRHRRKGGQLLDVEVSVQHTDLDGGRLVCFVRDISGRKRAQEAVRKSEERFRALIERSSEMIQVLDDQGRYIFWSQNATDESGWSLDDVLGTSALELIHEEDRARIAAALERVLATPGAVARDSYRFRRRDGSWRQVESVARNLLRDPAVQGLVINSRDVTARHELEEQLRQAQKLESVGRLAGGVAHDFNNILTVILSSGEALQRELAGADAETRENIEEIRDAGRRARDLTQQLLAFARKQVIAPVGLDLNAIITRNQKMLSRPLGEDVFLKVELAPDLWALFADPGQVEQVLMNLAVNARDAMPRGGVLTIATRNCRISGEDPGVQGSARPGEWVEVAVTDTGMGMPPEVLAHLFEPFFTTKEQGKGTGLGLATIYGVVTQAGGQIQASSAVGKGTTFLVRLPRFEGAALAAAPDPAPASTRGTERILVVEDDAQVRGVIVRALEADGYRVTALGHPVQALQLGPRELEDLELLVTDVVMPGIDGHALAQGLTRKHPGLRVLYLSGYTRDAISERGVLDSGAQFLAKPFTSTSLLAKVRAVLDAS
jgi:PAS domain S-box-containing protein